MRIAIFCVLLVLQAPLVGQADPFVQTIEKVKLSIFPVACGTWPDDKNGVSIQQIEGTGFFVDYEGDFITAAHVVDEHFKWNKRGQPDLDCFPVIYVPYPVWPSFKWFQVKSCTTNKEVDIAVCKTVDNPFSLADLHLARLHLTAKVPEDGTAVAFTGFPQLILTPVTSRANIAATGPFFDIGQVDILIDKTTWHGVSGGPLYLADGTVIGIIRKTGEGLWAGMGFARQASAILKFLSDQHIPVWQPEEKEKKKDK